MTTIYDSFDTLSDIQLAEFEKTIGYKLPKDYYQFLQHHNGGYPTPSDFEYQDPDRGTRTDMIRKFFGIVDRDDWTSLFRWIDSFEGYIAQGLLPIAHTVMNNYVFLALSGSNRGRIFYWHGDVHPLGIDLFFVADSFSEFLDNLFEYKEEDD